jgi:5-methylcytosine-specific restriction endonuclease McrA
MARRESLACIAFASPETGVAAMFSAQEERSVAWSPERATHRFEARLTAMHNQHPLTLSALDRPTLVLNRSWLPVNVTSVRRALVLVYRNVAAVVRTDTFETLDFSDWAAHPAPYPLRVVRTVTMQIPVPEVIVLRHYDRVARRFLPFSRRNLLRRDKARCQYCGRRPESKTLTIDHVTPRSLGGTTDWTNCVVACARCNGRKGGRTPEEVGMELLNRPERPEWSALFHEGVPWLQAFLSGTHRLNQ